MVNKGLIKCNNRSFKRKNDMDILDDMGVSKLSAKVFSKVNSFKNNTQLNRKPMQNIKHAFVQNVQISLSASGKVRARPNYSNVW